MGVGRDTHRFGLLADRDPVAVLHQQLLQRVGGLHPLLVACTLAALAGSAAAQKQPAVVYDMGGKFDKSFNQSGYDGAERWKKETGKAYLEFEISNPAQREQAKRRMAERGATPIVGIGFAQGSSMEKVAKDVEHDINGFFS